MKYDPKVKLQVFQERMTYQNDYCLFTPHKRHAHTWPKDRTEVPPKECPKYEPIDNESYQKWREGVYIPFNLLLQPRPIIDTNLNATIPKLEKPVDTGKEEAVKTRPRIYMSPAVSMDDVPDPTMRELLCQHMYSSDWQKAVKEAAGKVNQYTIPDKVSGASGDSVGLKTDLYPPLPDGWRQKGRSWDDTQRRAYVDPTKSFWINKDPPIKCGACTNPFKGFVSQEVKEDITNLIEKDKLRLAHDRPIPGYAGYKPRLSKGVPLSKVDLPVTHPFLSASQAVTQRYADDQKELEGKT